MVDFYREHVIGPQSDIWALGCLLFKMCTLRDAFPDGKLDTLNGQVRWSQPWPVDDFFKQPVDRCLRADHTARPIATMAPS
jgi:AP2-associated kinase